LLGSIASAGIPGRVSTAAIVVCLGPDVLFLLINGRQDRPNFNFVEIEKYWDGRFFA
jgi:hypothetical protein